LMARGVPWCLWGGMACLSGMKRVKVANNVEEVGNQGDAS
jgi:hypothetical protein